MTDERIAELIQLLASQDEGMANNTIWRAELLGVLREVQRRRERPTHCPGCDGDHP